MDLMSLLDDFLQQSVPDDKLIWFEECRADCLLENMYNNPSQSALPPTFCSPAILIDENETLQINQCQNQQPEFEEDVNTQRKRKRQDAKNNWETKRRNKFNGQLDTLRSLLGERMKNAPKITRENIMEFAIEEIVKLRQELSQERSQVNQFPTETDSPFQKIRTGSFPKNFNPMMHSLADTYNRAPYSTQDLERAFQIVYAREADQFMTMNSKRSDKHIIYTIKMLEDMSKQIGKPEYDISVAVLEMKYHSVLKPNAKQLSKILENIWNMYQDIKKSKPNDLLLVLDVEVGPWVLCQKSLLEYMSGNFEASERSFRYAKELVKRLGHSGTKHLMLAYQLWNLRGAMSVAAAQKIDDIIHADFPRGPIGKAILGTALITNGQHKEGMDNMDLAIKRMAERKGDATHLCTSPLILEACIQTGSVEKGLSIANYMVKKQSEYNIEGYLGKPELLRQKANLSILKKYPDFIPEPQAIKLADASIQEIVSLCESEIKTNQVQSAYGPLELSMLQVTESTSVIENDDIEMMLRSAMNLAQTRGLYTIELRCAIDLTRFFLHIGDTSQASDAVQIVKGCCTRMKGPADTRELQRALYVISLVEDIL